MASLTATAYIWGIAWFGLIPQDVVFVFGGLSVVIGFFWSVVGGIYIPWTIVRTWKIWQKLEIIAVTAELPIEQRNRTNRRITPIA